jgi:hypothetical protein
MSDNSADRHRWRAAIALRRSVIAAEEPADALPPPNGAGIVLVSHAVNRVVAETLVIAFAMIVDQELGQRAPEVPLTERNHAIHALFFD